MSLRDVVQTQTLAVRAVASATASSSSVTGENVDPAMAAPATALAAITAEGGELRAGIVTVPILGSRLSEKQDIGNTTEQHPAIPAAMVVVPRTSFGRVFVDNNLLEQAQMQGTHICTCTQLFGRISAIICLNIL